MDYVHFNSVKHRYTAHPAAWRYFSFRRCVAAGLHPADWTDAAAPDGDWGERR
jgi:putative transposase